MDQIDYFFERVKDGKYMREVETNGSNGEKVLMTPPSLSAPLWLIFVGFIYF